MPEVVGNARLVLSSGAVSILEILDDGSQREIEHIPAPPPPPVVDEAGEGA